MIGFEETHEFVDGVFGEDMHAKRVVSLANAVVGVINAGSLAVHLIGEGLAQARELGRKHCIKQVDRLLSNTKLAIWDLFSFWVPYLVGERKALVVALDWTEFDADDQSTLMLSVVTTHGRATPLLWKTVKKSTLKGLRNSYEEECLRRLAEVLPAGVKITVVADRGFGAQLLYDLLKELKFGYVIRFRGNIHVTNAKDETRPAANWVPKNGRAKRLCGARVTALQYAVGAVICVKAKEMAEAWCLVVSDPEAKPTETISLYGKRWGIEIYQPYCLLKRVFKQFNYRFVLPTRVASCVARVIASPFSDPLSVAIPCEIQL